MHLWKTRSASSLARTSSGAQFGQSRTWLSWTGKTYRHSHLLRGILSNPTSPDISSINLSAAKSVIPSARVR